jgi:hypothetical protein
MARSAARLRSLQRACDVVHDRAFNPRKYLVPETAPVSPPVSPTPPKSHKEWLEERFHQAVQREFARMGIV